MEERKPLDEDDEATSPEDWIGAANVRPGEKKYEVAGVGKVFFVFRSSKTSSLYVVLAGEEKKGLPEEPNGGEWNFFKKFPATGQPRIGFSEAEALADIRDKGYHLVNVEIQTTVGAAE